MPPGSFTGSVAELFAALGLDTSSFDRGLRESKVKLQVTADEMKRPIEGMRVLLSQLSTQAGPSAAIAAFDQLKLKVDSTRESITRLQRELWTALANGREALKNAESTVARQTLGTVAGGGAAGGGTIGGFGDDPSGGGRGSQMLVTRLTERFIIYHALRAAVRGVVDVFKEAEDITRRMDQTGWGSRGVQELATAAKNVHTPIESVTTAIGHLQTKVEAPDVGLLKVFDRLGIKYTEFRRLMETNPQGGFEQMATALSHVKDHGQLAINMMTVFGDHSGKLIEFITHWNDLKKEAAKNPVLTDADLSNMHQVTVYVDKLMALGARGIVSAVGAVRSGLAGGLGAGPQEGLYGNEPSPRVSGGIESRVIMGATPGTLGQGLAITPAPLPTDAKSLDNARRILDEYRASHELATRKMAEDYNTMLLLERQGLASRAQVEEFRTRANMKLREEEWKQYEEIFRKMTKTTTDYYNTLQEIAERPGLKEAMKWFERGLIDREELMRAKMRAKAGAALSETEQRFMQEEDMDPQELMNAFRQWQGETSYYRSRLQLPLAPSMPRNPFQGSTPGGPSQIITARPEGSMGASINLVPLDQFSESMVRHWMRQGMTTS